MTFCVFSFMCVRLRLLMMLLPVPTCSYAFLLLSSNSLSSSYVYTSSHRHDDSSLFSCHHPASRAATHVVTHNSKKWLVLLIISMATFFSYLNIACYTPSWDRNSCIPCGWSGGVCAQKTPFKCNVTPSSSQVKGLLPKSCQHAFCILPRPSLRNRILLFLEFDKDHNLRGFRS